MPVESELKTKASSSSPECSTYQHVPFVCLNCQIPHCIKSFLKKSLCKIGDGDNNESYQMIQLQKLLMCAGSVSVPRDTEACLPETTLPNITFKGCPPWAGGSQFYLLHGNLKLPGVVTCAFHLLSSSIICFPSPLSAPSPPFEMQLSTRYLNWHEWNMFTLLH